LDAREKARIDSAIQAARAKRDSDKVQGYAQAAHRAQRLWCDAVPATVEHPYLRAKHILALSLRQSGELLLVPLRDIDGNLLNLQTINGAGEKRFLKGGLITGCFALTGSIELPRDGEIYIAEGFATAATIACTLRLPVVAAMNAGNLKSVALAIRNIYPRLAIVIAADNDHRTPGNPGVTKGTEAASAVQGALSWPSVCMAHDCRCTDFNDCRQASVSH
jgi:putative DNA primase/helicase